MPHCAAPGCTRGTGKDQGISLHRFPVLKPELLSRWIENLGRKNYIPSSNARLCSEHFLPECFKEGAPNRRRKLKENAVPTLFPHRSTPPRHKTFMSPVMPVVRQPEPEPKRKDAKRLAAERTEASKTVEMRSPQIMRRRKKSIMSTISESTQKMEKPQSSPTTRSMARLEVGIPEEVHDPVFHPPTGLPFVTRKQKTPSKATSTVTRSMLGMEIESPEAISEASFVHRSVSPLALVPQKQVIIPVPMLVYGTPKRTGKDHPYSAKNQRTIATQTDAAPIVEEASLKTPLKSPEVLLSSPAGPESGSELTDVEYLPSSESSSSDSDATKGPDFSQMKKYIVFEENLMELMKFCKDCGNPVVSCNSFTRGSSIGYRLTCHRGHNYTWHSQPLVHKQPVGNLLIAASILVSGNTYAKVRAFADMLKLQLFSKTVYNKIQRNSVLPVIQEFWGTEKARAVEAVKSEGQVVLGGDARCDSPGHTAKYGSYTLMHASGDGRSGSRQIVSMQLVQVSEVKNSNHMEPEGLERCLKEVKEKGLNVQTLATDQHIMIASNMKKQHKQINHQFDVWHVAKGVTKKLTQASKNKDCQAIGPWIQSVSNHLWWACKTCEGDEQILREKWLSMLHHIVNKHQWSGNVKYHKCGHSKFALADQKGVKWLKETSPAFIAFKKIISNRRLLNSLSHLTKFCHTGELEVFHSMLLKYCPKRQHFHYDGDWVGFGVFDTVLQSSREDTIYMYIWLKYCRVAMSARLMLAAIDWNKRRRQRITDKSGKPAATVQYSKQRKVFVFKNRFEKTDSEHMFSIVKRVHTVHMENICLPPIQRPEHLPANVAPLEKPTRLEMEKRFKSRFM